MVLSIRQRKAIRQAQKRWGNPEPEKKLNSPKIISIAKKAVHTLTFAQALLAAYGGLIPTKYTTFGILAGTAISGALHLLTTIYPELSQQP